ncbi:immunoglobulin superfamily member 1-like [Emys orbicularis]|uniref:immunoglobulin superfamily member 1-like n=1 Tax=Emys orbicularis TaxID=82168 RepID=UPI0031FD6924
MYRAEVAQWHTEAAGSTAKFQGSYPKPSISVSPGGVIPMGGNVTIWCWHQHLGLRFLLYKDEDGNHLTYTDPAGSEAKFPITGARQEQSDNYTCQYHRIIEYQGIYSEPSDPVQIIVAASPYSKPSISLSPSGEIAPGTDVTISCHGLQQGVRFKMYRAGVARWHTEPSGSTAEFRIPNARREDGGNYTCSYESLTEPPVSSPHSDPVQLVVEAHYSKPSISLSPSREIAPGTDVTISCHGPRQGVRFKMYRAGVARWHTEPSGSTAEFRIPNARREDGGNYTCSYESLREPPVSSPHSDPVQLVVAGAPPKQDYPPFAIVRLSLAAGVLLALVLVLAEAAYSWRSLGTRMSGQGLQSSVPACVHTHLRTLRRGAQAWASGGLRVVAVVQEETLSYPCEASTSSHRIDLPLDAGEGEKKMQWMHGNTAIATYPPSGHHPSVLDVGEWGIALSSCMNLTLLVFDATGKERRTHYTAWRLQMGVYESPAPAQNPGVRLAFSLLSCNCRSRLGRAPGLSQVAVSR